MGKSDACYLVVIARGDQQRIRILGGPRDTRNHLAYRFRIKDYAFLIDQPHTVDAFAPPEAQADDIIKLLQDAIAENVKAMKPEEGSDAASLIDNLKKLQAGIVTETRDDIDNIEKGVSEIIGKVFPGYQVTFDAGLDDDPDLKNLLFVKTKANLRMGPADGHLSPIAYQGSGARRTLLWAALKYISETGKASKGSERPHLLLLDEPEICLHPSALSGINLWVQVS